MLAKTLKIEKIIFKVVLILLILPLGLNYTIETLDGPAHIYNSRLLNTILFGDNECINSFHSLNEIMPNILGHYLMATLLLFFNGITSEKILQGICILSLFISFRSFIKLINPSNIWLSYLILPFCYSFFFYLGFYNYVLSISFFFVTITYFIRIENRNIKSSLILSCLFLLTYFSHLFSFYIVFFTILVYTFSRILIDSKIPTKEKIVGLIKEIIVLIVIALPVLLLSLRYALKFFGIHEGNIFNSINKLLEWIWVVRPIVVFNYEIEPQLTIFYTILLIILFVIALTTSIINRKNNHTLINVVWLFIALVLIAVYFLLPNEMAGGGFVSERLLQFFYFFIIIWLCSSITPNWILNILTFLVSITISFGLYLLHSENSNIQAENVKTLIEAGTKIKDNSIVLPLNYSESWFEGHITNYLGIDNQLVVLENYEATKKYFPIIWNDEFCPTDRLGAYTSLPPCPNIFEFERITGKTIDYVVLWLFDINKHIDECSVNTQNILRQNYDSTYSSFDNKLTIYKRKSINLYKDKFNSSILFNSNFENYSSAVLHNNKPCCLLNNTNQYTPTYQSYLKDIYSINKQRVIKASIQASKINHNGEALVVVSFENKGRTKKYFKKNISIDANGPDWQTFCLLVEIPVPDEDTDIVKVYCWQTDNGSIYINELKVEILEKY